MTCNKYFLSLSYTLPDQILIDTCYTMQTMQQTFYIIAIVYMLVQICLFVGIGLMLLAVYRKIARITDIIEEKIGKVSTVLSHPGDIAAVAGSSFIQALYRSVNHLFRH